MASLRYVIVSAFLYQLSVSDLIPIIKPTDNFSTPDVSNHSNRRFLPNECGPPPQQRNHVAYVTSVFDFPWMVLLRYQTANEDESPFKCAGSLVTYKHALAPAHCLVNLPSNTELKSVRVGEYDTANSEDCEYPFPRKIRNCAPAAEDIAVQRIFVHPNYDRTKSLNYDVGLIKLSVNVVHENARPICLPLDNNLKLMNLEGATAVAIGYDQTFSCCPRKQRLVKTYMPIMINTRCNDIYNNSNWEMGSSQLCAAGRNGADWCVRISGGIFTLADVGRNRRYVMLALPSGISLKCETPGYPRVYTKTVYYMDWLLQNLGY